MNNEGILRLLLGDKYSEELFESISEEKENNFRSAIRGKVKTLPGAVSLLNELEDANILQAIGSSAPQANIDAIINELGITNYFHAIVSAAEMPSKPDPTVFLTAAQFINAPPERCVVFEDAIAGVEAAHRAGMKCVAITTTNEAKLLQAADLIIDRLDSISVDHLKKLFDK